MRIIQCPVCAKEAQWNDNPYRPFCSATCKNRDLGNWADERYRIPDETNEDSPDKKVPESDD